jgi:molybdenum cofactor biosynthesis protein MoaC
VAKPSHIDSGGRAKMVDVSSKDVVHRSATAEALVELNREAFEVLRDNQSAKGDVLTVAQLAGIQAAKKTSELIPLCHQVPLDRIEVTFDLDSENHSVRISSVAECHARTGVEMEALMATSIAALTIYDMLKAVQRDITIAQIRLVKKSGGRSGEYAR